MSLPASARRGLIAAAVMAAAVGLRAGDDLVIDGTSAEQPDEIVRFAPVVAHGIGGRLNPITAYDLGALFDQHVFQRPGVRRQVRLINGRMVVEGNASSPVGETLAQLASLRPLAERRIETLDLVCRLAESQRNVLRLAAESDLRRLAGEIDLMRRNYFGQQLSATPQGIDRERLQAVRDDAVACRRRIDQFLQSGSLLSSVSFGMLSPSQQSALETWVAERRTTRWEAMARTVLAQVDESVLGLSETQHDTILGQLLADVPRLQVFDDPWERPTGSKPADFQTLLVLSRLSRLDQAALRRVCDPRQWLALEQLMDQQGSPEAVEQLLVDQGVLEEDE